MRTPSTLYNRPVQIPAARVGRIAYANVAPVYHGFEKEGCPPEMNLVTGPPAFLNTGLAQSELDISPVSSAAYARNQNHWLLLPDLSISCAGPVMSVLLVSRVPFHELSGKRVILTRESETAAALSRYLFASHRVYPRLETGTVRRPEDLSDGASAGLVIGDAALSWPWADTHPYVWDLGRRWWDLTGLPFVFALWAVRREYAARHPQRVAAIVGHFHRSREIGCRHMDEIVACAAKRLGIPIARCQEYYRRLDSHLDARKVRGLQLYFDGLHREGILPERVTIAFFQMPDRQSLVRAA